MRRLLGVLFLLSCSSGSSGTYSDKCKLACDPSQVMACAGMDPGACQSDCVAFTSGLTALCATCVTQVNAWKFEMDQRFSGASGCHGYGFPSITDTSTGNCGTACK
jgi:hypothetical protein